MRGVRQRNLADGFVQHLVRGDEVGSCHVDCNYVC